MKRLILIAALTAASCGPRPEPFHPVTVDAPEGAFQRAMRGIVANGGAIETSDEKAGVITTKWEEVNLFGDDYQRTRWTITIGDGKATIGSQCENQVRGNAIDASWRPCDAQPAGRNEKARQLAAQIAQ